MHNRKGNKGHQKARHLSVHILYTWRLSRVYFTFIMPSVAPCPGCYAVFGAVRFLFRSFPPPPPKTSTTLISACRDRRKNGRSVVGGRCRGRRRHEIVHRGWSLLFLTVSVRFLPKNGVMPGAPAIAHTVVRPSHLKAKAERCDLAESLYRRRRWSRTA